MLRKKSDLVYKWVILVLCFLMVFFCAGFCCGNKSLYLAAITEAMDIKRSVYALTDSFAQVTSAVTSLFFGTLIYRFGPKKMVCSGVLLQSIAFFIYSTAQNVFGFYIGGALLGIGTCLLGTSMASTLIKRWFSADVGKFTGIVLAANGFGSALSAQVVSPMLNNPANPFGFRDVYGMFIPILLTLGIIFLLFIKNQPGDGHSLPHADSIKKMKRSNRKTGVHKPDSVFCFICISVFSFFLLIQSIYGTYAAYMKDAGLDAGTIATVASILTLALAASKMLTGFLYDKLGLPPVLAICQIAFILAMIFLICLSFTPSILLAILFALILPLSMPLETVCIPLITSEYFDPDTFERKLGILSACGSAGAALGSPFINLCYDLTGTYIPVIILWSIFMLSIAIGYRKLSREKRIINQQEAI